MDALRLVWLSIQSLSLCLSTANTQKYATRTGRREIGAGKYRRLSGKSGKYMRVGNLQQAKRARGGGLERKGAVKASKQNAMRATLAKRARRADWIILNFSIL